MESWCFKMATGTMENSRTAYIMAKERTRGKVAQSMKVNGEITCRMGMEC